MKATICVDYLAHEWDSTDLIHAHRETLKLMSENAHKRLGPELDQKEKQALVREKQKLTRFRNALWRQMARRCTGRLGKSNPMIDPSSVNWQKESDITWLYGPLYMLDHAPAEPLPPKKIELSGLKPVLKSTAHHGTRRKTMPSVSGTTFHSAPCPSSIEHPAGVVRFNPTIDKVKYLPESPVRELLSYWADDEAAEDATFWLLFQRTKQVVQDYVDEFYQPLFKRNRVSLRKGNDFGSTILSVFKAMVSFAATWLIYQSFAPFAWSLARTLRIPRALKLKQPSAVDRVPLSSDRTAVSSG